MTSTVAAGRTVGARRSPAATIAVLAVSLTLLGGCVSVQPSVPPESPGKSILVITSPPGATATPTGGPSATNPLTPAPTTSAEASASSSPTASPTPTATTTATPTEPATPTPSPTSTTGWTEAATISTNHYTAVDLVVDDAGAVHAAAALDRSIWYVTNSTGSWTRHQLSSPPSGRADLEPTIAGGGPNLFVAFTRYGPNTGFGSLPENIYYLSRTGGGAWSDPVKHGPPVANAPSIKARNGAIYMVYAVGVAVDVVGPSSVFPLHFATNVGGAWVDRLVSQNGTAPVLGLSAAGRFQIVFGDQLTLLAGNSLSYVAAGSNGFTTEPVPSTRDDYSPFDMAIDSSDQADLVYGDDLGGGLFFTRRSDGTWSTPVTLTGSALITSVAVATDSADRVHVVATTLADGVWYFTNRHGSWESKQLLAPPASGKWYTGSSAIAVDNSGRAQILFIVGKKENSAELYYAASPAV